MLEGRGPSQSVSLGVRGVNGLKCGDRYKAKFPDFAVIDLKFTVPWMSVCINTVHSNWNN